MGSVFVGLQIYMVCVLGFLIKSNMSETVTSVGIGLTFVLSVSVVVILNIFNIANVCAVNDEHETLVRIVMTHPSFLVDERVALSDELDLFPIDLPFLGWRLSTRKLHALLASGTVVLLPVLVKIMTGAQ